MSSRKISFFQINKREASLDEASYDVKEDLSILFANLLKKKEHLRHKDVSANKFCRLDSVKKILPDTWNVVFKAASDQYCAPLIHRHNGVERQNPKMMVEGERIKTHLVLKFTRESGIALLESGNGILTMKQIVDYFNDKLLSENRDIESDPTENEKPKFFFGFEIIAKENFLEEIHRLNRVIQTELIVDKQILGSDALNFSEQIDTVQEEVKIIIKAKKKLSITNAAVDTYNKLSGLTSVINKIRVKGKNEENNDVTLDTDFIKKVEFVNTHIQRDTGEVISQSIFDQMDAIAYKL